MHSRARRVEVRGTSVTSAFDLSEHMYAVSDFYADFMCTCAIRVTDSDLE